LAGRLGKGSGIGFSNNSDLHLASGGWRSLLLRRSIAPPLSFEGYPGDSSNTECGGMGIFLNSQDEGMDAKGTITKNTEDVAEETDEEVQMRHKPAAAAPAGAPTAGATAAPSSVADSYFYGYDRKVCKAWRTSAATPKLKQYSIDVQTDGRQPDEHPLAQFEISGVLVEIAAITVKEVLLKTSYSLLTKGPHWTGCLKTGELLKITRPSIQTKTSSSSSSSSSLYL
jgi:hypothetical protein